MCDVKHKLAATGLISALILVMSGCSTKVMMEPISVNPAVKTDVVNQKILDAVKEFGEVHTWVWYGNGNRHEGRYYIDKNCYKAENASESSFCLNYNESNHLITAEHDPGSKMLLGNFDESISEYSRKVRLYLISKLDPANLAKEQELLNKKVQQKIEELNVKAIKELQCKNLQQKIESSDISGVDQIMLRNKYRNECQ